MRSGDVRFRGRAHHFVIDLIVRFGRSCLATLRGVRDPAAQLAFELEYAKSDYGLGVAPAHIGQIKSQCFVRLRSFFSADVAELEDRHAVWGIIGATTPAASASALPNVRKLSSPQLS